MKSAIPILFALTFALWGQAERRTFVFDADGRRVPWTASTTAAGSSSSTGSTLNGATAPREQIEERIISESGGVKTVEKIVQRYSADGAKLPPERILTETSDLGGGRQSTTTTIYRGDFNGRLALAERTVEQASPTGSSSSTVTTQTERPTLNGPLEVIERREARLNSTDERSDRDETSYLKDSNGRFVEAARVVERTSKQGGKTIKQVDEFESATTGSLTLAKQVVSTTAVSASGVETTVSDVYGPAARTPVNRPASVARTPDCREVAYRRRRRRIVLRPASSGRRFGPAWGSNKDRRNCLHGQVRRCETLILA
jgi:hypothetical protein